MTKFIWGAVIGIWISQGIVAYKIKNDGVVNNFFTGTVYVKELI